MESSNEAEDEQSRWAARVGYREWRIAGDPTKAGNDFTTSVLAFPAVKVDRMFCPLASATFIVVATNAMGQRCGLAKKGIPG